MNAFDAPSGESARGLWLSRRQVLRRAGGCLAGALLASLGLNGGRSEASLQRVVSLRAVMQQINPACNPSHGLRLMLPDDGTTISLLDFIRRYYRG